MSILVFPRLVRQLTLGTAITALLLLVGLHILRPDIHTTQSMVSEYAIGKFGWIQTLVFLFFCSERWGISSDTLSRNEYFLG